MGDVRHVDLPVALMGGVETHAASSPVKSRVQIATEMGADDLRPGMIVPLVNPRSRGGVKQNERVF